MPFAIASTYYRRFVQDGSVRFCPLLAKLVEEFDGLLLDLALVLTRRFEDGVEKVDFVVVESAELVFQAQ